MRGQISASGPKRRSENVCFRAAVGQVFGRRRRRSNHALWRPAAEKRQCTKSRREIVGLRLPREKWCGKKGYGGFGTSVVLTR